MKASKLVQKVQELIQKYGDLDLVYAIDDEGNAYEIVGDWGPAVGNYNSKDKEFYDKEWMTENWGKGWEEDNPLNAICVN